MKMYLKIENNIIVDVKFKTFGCGAAVATSSMATEMIKGKSVDDALALTNKAVIDALGGLPGDMTAANFGNVSEIAEKGDVALGILNLVYEAVAMVSVFAARQAGVKDIVLTGNLTRLSFCAEKFKEINGMGYGVNFLIPELSQFSTVIGCALENS
jgi:hypothetical protein